MAQLRESGLTFDFDQSWHVVKWDDHPAYRQGVGKIQVRHGSLKAVDFVARRQGSSKVLFIEVKNYTSAEDPGPTVSALVESLKVKLCDSLTGVFGINDPDVRAVLGDHNPKQIYYIVWIEDRRRTRTVHADVVAKRLRKEIIKLTSVQALPATTTMNTGRTELNGIVATSTR